MQKQKNQTRNDLARNDLTRKNLGKNNGVAFPSLKSAALAAITVLAVGGCSMYQQPSYGPTVLRNEITVVETVERLELYMGQAGLHLSARDEDAMATFISQYASSGQGPLYINVPSSRATAQGTAQAHSVIQKHLGRLGIEAANLQAGQYPASPEPASSGVYAPVIVSYRRLTTAPINCSQGFDLSQTSNNQAYGNFGCAQTANLAALIDNPVQLLAPYGLDNAYAGRRMTVMGKYIEGEVTASDKPEGQEISIDGGG